MPFNSETARLAGMKSKATNKLKKQQWATMQNMLVGPSTANIATYMQDLWKEGKRSEYASIYLQLLNYFKPKLGSQTIQSQSEIIVKVIQDDKDVTIDI